MCRPRQSIVSPAEAGDRSPIAAMRPSVTPMSRRPLAVLVDDRAALQDEVVGRRHAAPAALAAASASGLRKGRPICKIRRTDPCPLPASTDRALVSVSGADAEHFLQNIVTADLDALGAGEAQPGALLTPQGKILFDFLISRDGEDGLRLECRRRRRRRFRAPADALPAAGQGRDRQAGSDGLSRSRGEDDPAASQSDSTALARRARFADAGRSALLRHGAEDAATRPRGTPSRIARRHRRKRRRDYRARRRLSARRAARPERRRRLQEGLLCRPGGRVAHAASRHGAAAAC